MTVCTTLGFSGCGDVFFGKGVVVLTGGLVVGNNGFVVVLVITGGAAVVVWTCGPNVVFGVVLGGTGD